MEITTDLRHFLSVTFFVKCLFKTVFSLMHPFSVDFKDKNAISCVLEKHFRPTLQAIQLFVN